MNKWLKRFLIFTLFLLLSLFLLILIPNIITTISDYISDQQTLEYQEYDKQGDNFVYEFKNEETYNYLVEIVNEYNKEFGYNVENKILMGKKDKETVFAEYNENSITIYCEDVMNGKLTNKQIRKYLTSLLNFSKEIIWMFEEENHFFINNLINYHSGLSIIMLPIIFETTIGTSPGYTSDIYNVVENILYVIEIISLIYLYIALVYLIYTLCYIIYCIILRKKINKRKERILLCILSIIYILLGGFYGIFSSPIWSQFTKLY